MKKQTLTIAILLATLFLAIAQIQFNPHIASAQSTPAKTSQNNTAPEPTPPNAMIAGLQKAFDASKPYLRGIIEPTQLTPTSQLPKCQSSQYLKTKHSIQATTSPYAFQLTNLQTVHTASTGKKKQQSQATQP
jgi:hypothetical protein